MHLGLVRPFKARATNLTDQTQQFIWLESSYYVALKSSRLVKLLKIYN